MKFILNSDKLSLHFLQLKNERIRKKKKSARSYLITTAQRKEILLKTNFKCHICGGVVSENDFHADHIVPHSSSTNNKINNFLPSCNICNRFRWFYDTEEIQWILKLGVFFRNEIEKKSTFGKQVAKKIIESEIKREKRKRRKN